MKFGYEGKELKDTIEKYEIKDNKIIIKYLDGSSFSIKYDKSLEKKILERMIDEAKKRDELMDIKTLKTNNKLNLIIKLLSTGLISMMSALALISEDTNNIKYIFETIFSLSLLSIPYNTIKYSNENDKIREKSKELEKYNIFLEMLNDKILFKEISEIKDLNINNLDNYSLNTIKMLKKMLDSYKENMSKNYYIYEERHGRSLKLKS